MKFEEFLNNAICDLQEFFIENKKVKIEVVRRNSNQPIAQVGSYLEKKIAINNDMAEFDLDDSVKYLQALIIAGHEIAHCLCEHNKHKDQSKFDSVAIEGFADYFGARISMTLLNFGFNTRNNLMGFYNLFPFSNSVELAKWLGDVEIFKCLGMALNSTKTMFYLSADFSGRYPLSDLRVMTFSAGVQSFFYRYRGGRISQGLTIKIFKNILFKNINPYFSYESNDDFIEKVESIHKSIQGSELRITDGLLDFYENLIGTEFNISKETKINKIKAFMSNFSSWDDDLVEAVMEKLKNELNDLEK